MDAPESFLDIVKIEKALLLLSEEYEDVYGTNIKQRKIINKTVEESAFEIHIKEPLESKFRAKIVKQIIEKEEENKLKNLIIDDDAPEMQKYDI